MKEEISERKLAQLNNVKGNMLLIKRLCQFIKIIDFKTTAETEQKTIKKW